MEELLQERNERPVEVESTREIVDYLLFCGHFVFLFFVLSTGVPGSSQQVHNMNEEKTQNDIENKGGHNHNELCCSKYIMIKL